MRFTKALYTPRTRSHRRIAARWHGALEELEARTLLSAGDLDLTFAGTGSVSTAIPGMVAQAVAVAVQTDGKYVAVGENTHSDSGIVVARYNPNGSLDTTFGSDGTGVVVTSGSIVPRAVAIQADGNIIVAGYEYVSPSLDDAFYLIRYLPNGSVDTSFGKSGVVTTNFGNSIAEAYAVSIQNDGKIIAVGTTLNGFFLPDLNFAIARYNTDGSLDQSFGSGGERLVDLGDDDRATSVAIDYNGTPATNRYYGTIVVGGRKANDIANPSQISFALARLTPSGNLDSSFGSGGQMTLGFVRMNDAELTSVIIQPGGKIVAAGTAAPAVSATSDGDFALARFLPNGAVDTSFGTAGGAVLTDLGGNDRANSVVIGFVGDLLVGGFTNTPGPLSLGLFGIAAYTPDGVLDPKFHGNGIVKSFFNDNGGASQLIAVPGRKIVAAGGNKTFDLARYIDVGPTVGVASLDPLANESTGKPATFYVFRDRRLPFPTDVYLNVEGTAQPTIYTTIPGDYSGITILPLMNRSPAATNAAAPTSGSGQLIKPPVPPPIGYVQIPANQTYTVVTITPIDDHVQENNETAIFTLRTNALYEVGTPNSTALQIVENDKPVLGDYDADGQADLPLFRSSTAQWFIDESSKGPVAAPLTGSPGDLPLQTNFSGGFRTEQSTYTFATSMWTTRYGGSVQTVQFGQPNVDLPVPADYDGDGKTDLAVYRPTNNTWYILRTTAGPLIVPFGQAGDIPVPAAYDGNQSAEVAVYRPSTAQFLILQPTGNIVTVKLGTPNAPTVNGLPGEVPISSDFTGDGKADPAVFEPATAQWRYINLATNSEVGMQFGAPGLDIPVPRDYDGDGKTDYAVFRPQSAMGAIWIILFSGGGSRVQPFGASTDTPVSEPLAYLLQGKVVFRAAVVGQTTAATGGAAAGQRAAALAIDALVAEQAAAQGSASAIGTSGRGLVSPPAFNRAPAPLSQAQSRTPVNVALQRRDPRTEIRWRADPWRRSGY